MRFWLVLAFGCLAMSGAVATAGAAIPVKGSFQVHDHQTPGDNWHVDARVAKSRDVLTGLVVHAERCGAFTPFARDVPIGEDGTVVANGYLDPERPEKGAWGVEAQFTTEKRLDGHFRFITPECDTGPMLFAALNGDGHSGHSHRTSTSGTPIGSLPDLSKAKGERRRELVRLYRASTRAARTKFSSYRKTIRAGYRRYSTANKKRQLFHVRHGGYALDDVWFDARRVESLVYYRPSAGRPILVAFMFRAPLGEQPRYGRPVLGWHAHGVNKNRIETQMTHLWLTDEMRTAYANCLPTEALERSVEGFALEPRSTGLSHESSPCTEAT